MKAIVTVIDDNGDVRIAGQPFEEYSRQNLGLCTEYEFRIRIAVANEAMFRKILHDSEVANEKI